MASREREPPHRSDWLRRVFLALLMITPLMASAMAAPGGSSPERHRSQPARFSDLAELTPANVHGLLPLVSSDVASRSGTQGALLQPHPLAHLLQVNPSAGADLRLQRFVDERVHLQLASEEPIHLPPVGGVEISYIIGTRPAAQPAAAEPGERELRAWDPIERRVVWSVTEALPVSARTLITAGGLVFYGTTDGWIKALDARTGRTLWKHRAEGRKLDEPFSYRGTDGHQYIGVHSLPQSLPQAPRDSRETLLIFALAH